MLEEGRIIHLGLGEHREGLLEDRGCSVGVNGDLLGLNLDTHLVVLVTGLAAGVLGILYR